MQRFGKGEEGGELPINRHTAKNQYRKFEYSQKRNCGPQSQFPHLCVCVSDLYIPTIDVPILQENMWTDPGNI